MKGLHLLALAAATYTPGIIENIQIIYNLNTFVMAPDPNYPGIVYPYPDINNMIIPAQEFNHIPENFANLGVIINPIIVEYNEVDMILNSCFFEFLKNSVSFFLYNISILKPVFAAIYNKQVTTPFIVKRLEISLLKFISLFKANALRMLLKTEENANPFQLECLAQHCKTYLLLRNIPYENLSLAELKKSVIMVDPRLELSHEEFDSRYNYAHSEFFQFTHDYFYFDEHTVMVLLNFTSTIHDLISSFNSTYRYSLNAKLYPMVKKHTELLGWIFKTIARISVAPISESFFNEIFSPFALYYSDVELISGFIITLAKIVQAYQAEGFFPYDIFLYTYHFLSGTLQMSTTNNGLILANSPMENIISMFLTFLNEIKIKRNNIKLFENHTGNDFSFMLLNPIVNEFFKALITTVGSTYSPNSVPKRKERKVSNEE